MTRVLELLVSILIVATLIIVIGVLLPSHGRIERSVEVSNPVRQIYDSVNTLRRFPEWSAERRLDPKLQMQFEGPRSGVDAAVKWTGDESVGNGSLKIVSTEQDSQVKWAVEDAFAGENKSYTIRIEPAQNARTSRLYATYEVDYGWNLLWRYAGMYIHGKPDAMLQTMLANYASMLATIPNADYKDQEILVADATAVPLLLVSTKSPRTLDDLAEATEVAVTEIQAFIKKAGLNQAGPVRTLTTNYGDDSYVFDVAIPVDSATFELDGKTYTIDAAPEAVSDSLDEEEEASTTLKVGDRDDHGYLVLDGKIRATQSYAGMVLATEYTGSPAYIPLLRLFEKAYSDSNGFQYSEIGNGRFWDEAISTDADGVQTFKVYLPIDP